MTRRLAAAAALILPVVVLMLTVDIAVTDGSTGLLVLAALALAVSALIYGLLRTGIRRLAGLLGAVLLLAVAVFVLVEHGDHVVEAAAIVACVGLTALAARTAFRVHVPLSPAPAPKHPVLFFNPKSGGGKAERFNLDREARARGIRPIELTRGADLEQLVRTAVAEGADGLAMAGGDGSQAIVAAVAAELDLPYSCVPAGTRNHFALDLGVDREDVVGALDAFVDGGEKRVDLAEINGKVFVNNVSLGVYAEAVQSEGYRDAKLRTILDTLPGAVGPDGEPPDLRWTGPGGHEHSSGAAILVSNNLYRLGRAVGSGTRPRIDDGLLGVTVLASPSGRRKGRRLLQRPWREWSTPEFVVDGSAPIAAGIDGEAAQIDPPLLFRIRPGVLRVRVARNHPGASPSAAIPEGTAKYAEALGRIALGLETELQSTRPANEHNPRR